MDNGWLLLADDDGNNGPYEVQLAWLLSNASPWGLDLTSTLPGLVHSELLGEAELISFSPSLEENTNASVVSAGRHCCTDRLVLTQVDQVKMWAYRARFGAEAKNVGSCIFRLPDRTLIWLGRSSPTEERHSATTLIKNGYSLPDYLDVRRMVVGKAATMRSDSQAGSSLQPHAWSR